MNQSIQVEKKNIYKISHHSSELTPLEAGEIRFKIDKYALTSNNITYAVSGFKLKYWNFFPADEPNGIVPVWGYAEVSERNHPGIEVGERCYGYFPMADYWTIQPHRINKYGFSDGAEHRRRLAPIYNYYSKTAVDPTFNEHTEDYIPIVKPLFATSFLIYRYLKKSNFLDADQMILTSASSKTGLGLAFMLKQNQEADGKKIIGLTSARNVEFVKSTGYYDQVIAYEDYVKDLKKDTSVIIDFAGNAKSIKTLSETLGDALKFISLIGLTDWKNAGSFSAVEKAEFFFAPTHIQNMYKEEGPEKANIILNKNLVSFITDTKKMIELEAITDFETFSTIYLGMVDGKVNPKKGYLVKI